MARRRRKQRGLGRSGATHANSAAGLAAEGMNQVEFTRKYIRAGNCGKAFTALSSAESYVEAAIMEHWNAEMANPPGTVKERSSRRQPKHVARELKKTRTDFRRFCVRKKPQ